MSKQSDMTSFERVLYTSKTHTKSGREGASQSSDRCLDIKLSIRGSAEVGTNPEQLFAAGWAACFIGAMGLAAIKPKVMLAAETSVDAEVNLSTTDSAYFLRARLHESLPGMDSETAPTLAKATHETCPFSKATRGNIDVTIDIV